jgi:hypothetical protein
MFAFQTQTGFLNKTHYNINSQVISSGLGMGKQSSRNVYKVAIGWLRLEVQKEQRYFSIQVLKHYS